MSDPTFDVDHSERSVRTAELVDRLHTIVDELEAMHPGRRFPLDGHLVGSIGEAAAEALFDIQLMPASTAGHDALAADGRAVEIKATYGNSAVSLRTTSHGAAAALIVLRLSRTPASSHQVIYNGSLIRVAAVVGKVQSNGQARLPLSRLRLLDATVPATERVPERQPRPNPPHRRG